MGPPLIINKKLIKQGIKIISSEIEKNLKMKNDAWLNKKFIERAKELNRIGLFNLYPTESWALLPTINECNSILDIGCADGNKLPICRKINKKN